MGNAFKQCFWRIDDIPSTNGDITASYREKVANAASEVLDDYKAEIAFAVSCGGKDAKEGPEISLVVDLTNYLDSTNFNNLISTLTQSIQSHLDDEFQGTDVSPVPTLLTDIRSYKFDESQMAVINSQRNSDSVEDARALHKAVASIPLNHFGMYPSAAAEQTFLRPNRYIGHPRRPRRGR